MTDRKFYTKPELLDQLALKESTFVHLKASGRLPFVVELLPRLGKHARYRADLVERYLAGAWNAPRPSFGRRRAG